MKRSCNILFSCFFCVLIILFLLPGFCLGDTLTLKTGDVLVGSVLTPSFTMITPYGGIRVSAARVRTIRKAADKDSAFVLKTINNDLFSGSIMEKQVNVRLNTGASVPVGFNRVSALVFDRDKPTFKILTTIFFMKNNDRFSGSLSNKVLHIQTGHELMAFKTSDFSQIVFGQGNNVKARTLITDRTNVSGLLMERQLKIAPSSVTLIAPCVDYIAKIQFNAEKLVADKDLGKEAGTYDSDGDGVPDTADKCPSTGCAVAVDEKGCPVLMDSNKDGIPDKKDLCPNTPWGLGVDSSGCWVVYMTHFDFNEYTIPAVYFKSLDRAADILISHPEMRVEIQGHTDNKGTSAYNKMLSLQRARAVMAYLVKKGVPAKQMKAVGYGFDRPLRSNDTEAGRAENRRVQIQQVP